MGKAIEEIALSRGHEIVLRININNTDEFNIESIKNNYKSVQADVLDRYEKKVIIERAMFRGISR